MSFDFAVDDLTSGNDADNDQNDDTEDFPFEHNETGELYMAAKEAEWTLRMMLKQMELDRLKIQGDDTLEDISRLLGDYTKKHPMQKLHMVYALFKSTAGKAQQDNDHSIGFNSGKAPESHPDNPSFALFSKDLPSITWEFITDEEVENLEEMGVEVDTLSFDTTSDRPKILSVNGQRLPIAVEEGDEVLTAAETLSELPNEPSRYTEDGFVESSDPSVFGDTDTSDGASETKTKVDDENGASKYPSFSLAEEPTRVSEVQVEALRGQNGSPEALHLSKITSSRTMKRILQAEKEGKNRKSAVSRIEERLSALDGSDDEEATDDEEADNVEGSEEVEVDNSPLSEAQLNLIDTLIDNGIEADFESAKARVVGE
jgi:hypothetical protein